GNEEPELAQMKGSTFLFTGLLLVASLVPTGAAADSAQVVPAAGIQAEASEQWDAAVGIYKQALTQEPNRADLWIRIANIESRRGNVQAAIEALRSAAHAAPSDATIFRRLSQAYAENNQPAAAIEAIDGALVHAPDSPEYLRAAGVLATWNNDYVRARRY